MKLKREANIEWILKAKRGLVDKFGYIFGYFGVLTFSNNKSCKLLSRQAFTTMNKGLTAVVIVEPRFS